ncbi:MAG: phage integrase Arm DNA-binding domain-containing protein [Methylicorpusculum sp.]|jgi:integrase|uniref:phage integrase Arm DNA-binding domain-containing protein n=2 Tax=Methylicorpusculum TaxID=2713642 RepID=UPI001357CE6A|nr:phage integrase Arm DNA-binding domain-containing protein [Methylicorpusculum sp.]MBS3952778.1 phage integrase Arm DNA-binding domain-containing protein [Methylomicrobium sp.]MDP2203385.1 phage integrase Arm DNA-binding domain-containing protein [Methylicorpusculum sp.]
MSPRQRSTTNRDLNKIPNLYRKFDKRRGKLSFQYKDPRNGKFWGLGPDEETAKNRAKQLNAAIYSQLAQTATTDCIMAEQPRIKSLGIPFKKWVDEYLKITHDRLQSGEIKPNTYRTRIHLVKRLGEIFGDKGIKGITVKEIVTNLDAYRATGKERMAQSLRSTLIDVFAEAIQAGELDSNPATMTKNKTVRVKRARLTFETWQTIFDSAESLQPWVQNAMLLAILTGQRLEDIALARFKRGSDWEPAFSAFIQKKPHSIKPYTFIDGEFLHVPQQKTRALIKIPLALRLECIDTSLGDVVTRCRKHALSQYLVHHTRRGVNQEIGDPVHLNTVSKGFQKARQKSGLVWDGSPPTFHEQRSLAERLYRDQGIDTQRLLGHKSAKMTDVYHDSRGAEWLEIAVK